MISYGAEVTLGQVRIVTQDEGGHTPEQMAELALRRIMHIADSAAPAIREQAMAFREQMYSVLVSHMQRMAEQERLSIAAKLRLNSYNDVADVIERGGLS